jgi:aryl carrier-like protein
MPWYDRFLPNKSGDSTLAKSVEPLNLGDDTPDEHIIDAIAKEAKYKDIDPYDHANSRMMSSYSGSGKKYYFEEQQTDNLNQGALINMSKHHLISSIIGSRINQCAEFGQYSPDEDLGYKIVLKDEHAEMTDDDKKNIVAINQFLQNCGSSVIDYELTFESFIRQIIRDSLVFDKACFEIIKNRKGQITGFMPVDATTIKKAPLTEDEIESGRKDPAGIRYIQVINNKVVAEYKQDELCFGIRRPRTDIRRKGLGHSELEELYGILNNLFNAETYNSANFTNGINANGIIAVKSKMAPQLFRSFRREFYQMLNGVGNAKRTPLIQLDPDEKEDISSINLQPSNREMEYNNWINYLIKVACGVYQIDPAEIGFVFGSETQSSSLFGTDPSARVLMGKEKGLRPLVRSLQSWINRYIIDQVDDRYKLVFTGLDSVSLMDKMKLEEHKMKYMTLNEIRTVHDLPELDDGDILAAAYTGIKIATIKEHGILVAEEVGKDDEISLEEAVEEEHDKELELDGEDVNRADTSIDKAKVDIDGDGQEHPAQYFEGLDEETKRKREAEMERRKKRQKETGEVDYSPLPGDEMDKKKQKQNKGTKSKKADEVREEIKKPGKDEFLRACAKVSGVKRSIIEEVYDKGLAAYATSGHRPGQTPQSWARARVYAFLFDSKSGARSADKELWEEHLESKKALSPSETKEVFVEGLAKSDTYKPTQAIADEALRGIKAIEEHGSDAGTQVGRVRARQLANRDNISYDTVKRMKAFFDRHEKNKEVADNKEWYEDNGFVSWLLWGGDSGRKWAEMIIEREEKEDK